MVNAGVSSAGWMRLAQMVARSSSRLVKLCTGWSSVVRFREAFFSAGSERWAGATGLVRLARAAGLSWSWNRIGATACFMCQAM